MGQKPDPLTSEPRDVSSQAGARSTTLPDDGGLAPTAKADPYYQAMKSSLDANGGTMDPEARTAREEIERTRGQMSETIDEISERLDPQLLAQQAKSAVRSATIGKLEEKVSSVGAKVQGAVSTAGDNLGEVANRMRDAAIPAGNAPGETARTVRAMAARTGRSWAATIRAHPLPAAALGFGLGCLLSLGIQKLRGPEAVNTGSYSTTVPYS